MPIINLASGRGMLGGGGGYVEFGNVTPNIPYGDTTISLLQVQLDIKNSARLLLAFIGNYSSTNTGTPSSVTYRGQALSQLARAIRASGAYPAAEVWYLENPPASVLDTVNITMPGNTNVIACTAAVYGDVQNLAAITGASSSLVSAASTVLGGAPPVVIDVLVKHYKSDGLACASSQTLLRSNETERATANMNIEMGISVGYEIPVMAWSWSNTRNYGHICVTF